MNEQTNNSVLTKAQIISPLAFQRDKSGDFTHNYKCKVIVKVLKQTDTVVVFTKSEYISATGTYGQPDYVEGYTKKYPYMDISNFNSLISAGISIDFDDVLKAYENELVKIKEIEKQESIEKEKQRKIQKGLKYDKSWIWDFIKNVNSHTSKNLKDYDFELKPCDKESYVNGNGELYIEVLYKNVKGEISFEEPSRYSHTPGRYIYNGANEKIEGEDGKISYRYINISNYKTRYSSKPKTIVLKFLKEYDKYVEDIITTKKRKLSEEKQRLENKKFLEKASGLHVEIEKTYKRNIYNRNSEGYYVYKYVVNLNNQNINISFNTIHGKWISEEHRYEDLGKEYSIGCLTKLSKDKLQKIINILS